MAVQQFLHRSLPSHASRHHRQNARMSETHQRRSASLQASLAEMMLVNRLRAHVRKDLSLDTLQRAAAIIELTAKHWFAVAAIGDEGRLKAHLTDVSAQPI